MYFEGPFSSFSVQWLPYHSLPCAVITHGSVPARLRGWPSFWSQLLTCKGLRLCLALLCQYHQRHINIKTKLLTSPLWSFKLQFSFPRWRFVTMTCKHTHAHTGSEGINDTSHAVETVNEMLLLILCVTYAICWYFIWGIIEVHLQPASGNSLREYHCSFAPRITISSCKLHIDPSGESFILELLLKAPTHRCSCQAAR